MTQEEQAKLREIHIHLSIHDWREFYRSKSRTRPLTCKYRYCAACNRLPFQSPESLIWKESMFPKGAHEDSDQFADVNDGAKAAGIEII
jgi:hypothetical protein